jgi:hypothetical protein
MTKSETPPGDEAKTDAEPIGVAQSVDGKPRAPEPYRGPERRAQGYLIAEVVAEPSPVHPAKTDSPT